MEAQKHNAHPMIEADCGLISSSDSAAPSGSLKAQHRPPRSSYLAIFILAVKPPRCWKNITWPTVAALINSGCRWRWRTPTPPPSYSPPTLIKTTHLGFCWSRGEKDFIWKTLEREHEQACVASQADTALIKAYLCPITLLQVIIITLQQQLIRCSMMPLFTSRKIQNNLTSKEDICCFVLLLRW